MSKPELSIESSDFRKAARALEKGEFSATAARPLTKAIRDATNLVRKNARAELRPHNKTRKMSGNIRTRFRGRGLDFTGGVKTTGVGSNLIVGGVRPHEIAPGHVMPLWAGKGAWKGGAGAGITGFATAVQHPGFGPDPFFHRAIQKSIPQVNAILDAAGKTLAQDLAHKMEG